MTNPYLIQGPASISFSGGRTSAYMLQKIVEAHGGKLPDDVMVTFANTGKERAETLRFVHDCATHWGVHIRWVEWRPRPALAVPYSEEEIAAGDPDALWWLAAVERCGDAGFEEVGFNSASRRGEPLTAVIRDHKYLPNPLTRFCTTDTKVRTMQRYLKAQPGMANCNQVIGLRHDEGMRVMKALARNDSNKEPFKVVMPMAKARAVKRDVLTHWLGETMRIDDGVMPQGFDLGLRDHEGNCDLCMLKAEGKLIEIIRADPSSADWWIAHEARTGQPFRKYGSRSYAQLKAHVAQTPDLFDARPEISDDDHDVECGLLCEPD